MTTLEELEAELQTVASYVDFGWHYYNTCEWPDCPDCAQYKAHERRVYELEKIIAHMKATAATEYKPQAVPTPDGARTAETVRNNRKAPGSQNPPRVFISYRHSSSEHKQWVQQFGADLITEHNVDCILDQFDLDYGDSILEYMHRIQEDITHVVLVITPECTTAIERNSGGIAFEAQLATVLRDKQKLRLIPLLRAGTNVPSHVRNHLYIDFRDDTAYENQLALLADSLNGVRRKPIALGEMARGD